MTTSSKSLLLLATAALLTACGGAPSESDIKGAIARQQEQQKQQMSALTSMMPSKLVESMTVKVKDVHKVGCKEDGENAYRCDVEIEVEQGGKSSKGATSSRFVKGTDGWVVGN